MARITRELPVRAVAEGAGQSNAAQPPQRLMMNASYVIVDA
ncbi:MAG TPA: hypothetical protein VFW88_01210 [Burkholderiales bacterium]|nr:hypothetical protein [Burkholderiales bacterium]